MKARTPTSTLSPPLITPVTVPTIVAFSANAFSSADQSFGPLDFGASELVVAFGIAALHRDRHLVAGLWSFAAALEVRKREDAFALEADVEEDRIGGDGDDCAFELLAAIFALLRVALLILREQVAKGLGGFVDRLRFRDGLLGNG